MDQISQKTIQFINELKKSENTLMVSQSAFSVFADILPVARIDVILMVPKSDKSLQEENNNVTLYRGNHPEGNEVFEVPIVTGQDGNGCFRVVAAEGHTFTDEEKSDLEMILGIFRFHSGRYHLIEQASEFMFIQYMTGLPNAGGFMRRISRFFKDGSFVDYDVYCFNLKGFWSVNKKYGYREGDLILRRYAQILRKSVCEDEVVGHLGGDNFVAMIRKERRSDFLSLIENTETTADRFGKEEAITISSTIGIVEMNPHMTPERVLGDATTAMNYAKRTRKPIVFMTGELNRAVSNAKQIEERFPAAILNNEFQVYYQPKVNTETGEIFGAEALSRWVWNGQVIPAEAYISILEQSEDILSLDMYMLEKVCQDLHAWKQAGKATVPLSVNISRKDINNPKFASMIKETIAKYDIASEELLIEVTETANEEEKDRMVLFLKELASAGIRSSIDDFGTGYSSLSALREFPVSEIKIDRSFIDHDLDESDRIILRNIIDMAEELQIHVISEGVEKENQVFFLTGVGCHHVQGFFYDMPLERKQFEERMEKRKYDVQ